MDQVVLFAMNLFSDKPGFEVEYNSAVAGGRLMIWHKYDAEYIIYCDKQNGTFMVYDRLSLTEDIGQSVENVKTILENLLKSH